MRIYTVEPTTHLIILLVYLLQPLSESSLLLPLILDCQVVDISLMYPIPNLASHLQDISCSTREEGAGDRSHV